MTDRHSVVVLACLTQAVDGTMFCTTPAFMDHPGLRLFVRRSSADQLSCNHTEPTLIADTLPSCAADGCYRLVWGWDLTGNVRVLLMHILSLPLHFVWSNEHQSFAWTRLRTTHALVDCALLAPIASACAQVNLNQFQSSSYCAW